MSIDTSNKMPKLFWTVAIAALVWNALGVMAYIMDVTMSEDAMAALPLEQQALYSVQPSWVTAAFAIAVFAGLAGSIALVMRKSIATTIFAVSLAAVIAQMYYAFGMSDMIEIMGASSAIMPSAIIVVAAALVWFSTSAKGKGWIG